MCSKMLFGLICVTQLGQPGYEIVMEFEKKCELFPIRNIALRRSNVLRCVLLELCANRFVELTIGM